MATKAEMQAAFEHCGQVHRRAMAELQQLNFLAALELAESALPQQHAAVTFQRRFQDVASPAAPLADFILHYAPCCFLSRYIEAVESWYLGGTKTERAALPDMPGRIAGARNLLAHAVELWGVMAESPSSLLEATTDARSKTLLQTWKIAAVVSAHAQQPNACFRVTDPHREAVAKCFTCGRESRAALTVFLEPCRCPACGRRSDFIILRRALP